MPNSFLLHIFFNTLVCHTVCLTGDSLHLFHTFSHSWTSVWKSGFFRTV